MTLSKHEQDFADAMALKLRLNREARLTEARLREEHGDFRYDIAAKCVSDHQKAGTAGPGLTVAHVADMMHELTMGWDVKVIARAQHQAEERNHLIRSWVKATKPEERLRWRDPAPNRNRYL